MTEVLWPAESIYDGTWGGEEIPLEVAHFELMRQMHWTWRELMETPAYVLRYCADLLGIRQQAEIAAQERANAQAEREAQRGH